MSAEFRILNDSGLEAFREYIASGASGEVPRELLRNPETSSACPVTILIERISFQNRFEFGQYLGKVLSTMDQARLATDRHIWSSLALQWFDLLCPVKGNGKRDVKEECRYILSRDYRHFYRHLVRSPWQLVRDHGDNSRFLLIAPRHSDHPLSVHGEILEQIGSRQQVLGSPSVIAAANALYFDHESGRPKKGAAGSSRGSARRLGLVLRQLDLTFDAEGMPEVALFDVLPEEFERWMPEEAEQHSGLAGSAGS
ncbi:hypothetical protein V6X63_10525 [Spiribacter sp. 221]|uniref:hypothetical protein n=1 Tax=Spiribacter onubensis TaxID=3122420 RepID=UPI00349F55A2